MRFYEHYQLSVWLLFGIISFSLLLFHKIIGWQKIGVLKDGKQYHHSHTIYEIWERAKKNFCWKHLQTCTDTRCVLVARLVPNSQVYTYLWCDVARYELIKAQEPEKVPTNERQANRKYFCRAAQYERRTKKITRVSSIFIRGMNG